MLSQQLCPAVLRQTKNTLSRSVGNNPIIFILVIGLKKGTLIPPHAGLPTTRGGHQLIVLKSSFLPHTFFFFQLIDFFNFCGRLAS